MNSTIYATLILDMITFDLLAWRWRMIFFLMSFNDLDFALRVVPILAWWGRDDRRSYLTGALCSWPDIFGYFMTRLL
jgi:hypothetical protein